MEGFTKMRWEPITGFMYEHIGGASKKLFDKFINMFGFDMYAWSSWPRDFKKFLYGDRSYNAGNKMDSLPPFKDHAIAFKKKGTKQIIYVFHPYLYEVKEINALEQWCKERDLIYIICPSCNSFYYRNFTKMIFIMSPTTYVELLRIDKFPLAWEEPIEGVSKNE